MGAFTSGLNSYIDQTANGGAVDWGTLALDTLEGGIIGGISGGIGGAAANAVAGQFGSFCGKSAGQIAAQVGKKWAVGTVADGVSGTAASFVSNMFDTKGDVSESLQRTGDSLAQIWGTAAITSTVSVAAEAAVTPKCFVAGTAVVTSVGLVAIEHIKPGDMVLAANEETGEIAYKEVVQTFTNISNEITHVTVTTEDGQTETIDATPHHPFYVEGKGWVDACALHAGMVVWLADGTKAIVTDVVTEGLEHPVTVYNFEVTDFHTYFVGDSGVLVHNTGCSEGQWEAVNESMSDNSRDYQELVTGHRNEAWVQNGVKYDGQTDGVLLEVKGKYSQFVDEGTGKFKDWFTGAESLVEQAQRQISASNGMKVKWVFAEESTMKAFANLLEERKITGIEVTFQPPK